MSVTPTPVCRNPYDRPNGVRLLCTYVRNHRASARGTSSTTGTSPQPPT